MALHRNAGSLAIRAAAAYLRRHRPHPPPPLALAAPAPDPTPIRRPFAPQCRHFAAPPGTQVNRKRYKEEVDGPRMNNAITAPFVRLVVTDEGHSVVPRHEALQLASRMNMDLVEVDRKAKPPVCKIMDFHKEKYKQEIKIKERLKTKSAIVLRGGEIKEVRFKGKTELKDLMVKADGITRLMERGHRVKCMAMPSGNEGEDLGTPLSRLLELIQDVCIVESGPHLDSKHAYVIVRHVKFAAKKRGKKASQAIEESSGKGAHSAVSESPVDGSISKDKTVGDGLGKPDDRTISDHVKKTATHLIGDSGAQKEQDREFKSEFNSSKSNPGAGGNRINSGQWGPQASEHGLGHKDLQPGIEKRDRNLQNQGPVETNRYAAMEKRESNVQDQGLAETNRYAARRQPIRDNNRGFNQGIPPQDDRRNENRGHYDNQRPLEQQHNRPLPRFNQGGLPQDSRNERRSPFPLNNNQRPPAGGGDPNRASKSFGIFSSTQKSGASEQKRNSDGTSKPGNTDPPKSFGIFSSRK